MPSGLRALCMGSGPCAPVAPCHQAPFLGEVPPSCPSPLQSPLLPPPRTNGGGTCPALQLVLGLLPGHVHLQQRHRGLSGQGADGHPRQPARDHDGDVSAGPWLWGPCSHCEHGVAPGGGHGDRVPLWGRGPCPSLTLPRFSPGFSCIKHVNREIISLGESNYGAKPLLGCEACEAAGAPRPRLLGGGGAAPAPHAAPCPPPTLWSPPRHPPCWRKPCPQAASCPQGCSGGVIYCEPGVLQPPPARARGAGAQPAPQPSPLLFPIADAWSSTASSPSPPAPSPPTRSCGGCKCGPQPPSTLNPTGHCREDPSRRMGMWGERKMG